MIVRTLHITRKDELTCHLQIRDNDKVVSNIVVPIKYVGSLIEYNL